MRDPTTVLDQVCVRGRVPTSAPTPLSALLCQLAAPTNERRDSPEHAIAEVQAILRRVRGSSGAVASDGLVVLVLFIETDRLGQGGCGG